MDAVFEPSLLFISDENWNDEEIRDDFLNNLLKHLEYINKYDICNICWTIDFDELLWSSPQIHPWFQTYWSRFSTIPIIYKKLQNKKNYLDCDNITCNTNNILKSSYDNGEALELFYKLIHYLIILNENFYLCLGHENKITNNSDLTFDCICHTTKLTPELLNNPDDWINKINITEKYFPKTIEEFDEYFNIGLELFKMKDFSNRKFVYDYEFDKSFKKSIIDRTTNKEKIFIAIVKRLIFTDSEAGKSELQNEFIEKSKQYRFRVNQETRIHYRKKDNKIIFLQYYGEGEHDDGL